MDARNLRTDYEKIRPLYSELVREVTFALEEQLAVQHIKVAGVVGRTKTAESVIQKIERKQYEDPLSEIDDLAGVRVICLFEADLDKIESLVRTLFSIKRFEDKTGDLGLDRMGYQSRHCVVGLSPDYQGPRYNRLSGLRCEIQIRTILQDAWAQLSHNLVYKSESSIPPRVHRQLNHVSSLLEIAQSVFDNVRQLQRAYLEEIEGKKDAEDFLSQPINSETLSVYTWWKYPGSSVDPHIHELLIRDLDHNRFTTLSDVDRAVNATADVVECYSRENPGWFRSGTDFITKSLGFFDEGFRNTHPFGSRTREAFRKYGIKQKRK